MLSKACYECVFIGRHEISAGRVEDISDKITEMADAGGGKIVKREYWGLRKLAYRIRKNRKGHFALLGLEVSSETMKEIEYFLRLNEDIIRHLVLRVDEIDMNPSPILVAKPGRDDRRRDRGGGYQENAGESRPHSPPQDAPPEETSHA